jgi:two-component system OmpR family sensor kinase
MCMNPSPAREGAHPDSPHPDSAALAVLERLLALPAFDVRDALNRSSDLLAPVMAADKVDVFLHDPTRDSLVALGTSDTPMGRRQHALGLDVLPLANGGRAAQVYTGGAPFCTGETDHDPEELPGIRGALGVRSTIAVPLDAGGTRRGVLMVASANAHMYGDADLRFLAAVSHWVGMVLHRAELSERLAAEAAARVRRETAEELITVLAHDLRHPLVPAIGYAELIVRRARREGWDQIVEYAKASLTAAQRLNGMIGDLLDVARLNQGLFAPDLAPVDLAALAHEAAEAVHAVGQEIAVQAEGEFVAEVDAARVRQALENLLGNALRHSPAGIPVALTVSREADEDGEWAVLAVRDEGPGIAPERLGELFERFRPGPGSKGLGLHLARGIAEAHGGTLGLESAPGAGATFVMRLAIAAHTRG